MIPIRRRQELIYLKFFVNIHKIIPVEKWESQIQFLAPHEHVEQEIIEPGSPSKALKQICPHPKPF